jgi:hypothetical protein
VLSLTTSAQLTLHCTLIKAPPRRHDRFDGAAILSLAAELGTYDVDEILLCRMGAYDQTGRHIAVGGVSLRPD